MKAIAKNFLPELLRRRAAQWEKREDRGEDIRLDQLLSIESLFRDYHLSFPFFSKIDAWRAYNEESDHELWVLERVGWGEWNGEWSLLYCMEGISIPLMEDSEIITVNSISPPFLANAVDLEWSEEILADAVQVAKVGQLPDAIRYKLNLHIAKFLYELAETLTQMEIHQIEFEEYVEKRIREYTARLGDKLPKKLDSIGKYFREERRVELFHDFLEEIQTK